MSGFKPGNIWECFVLFLSHARMKVLKTNQFAPQRSKLANEIIPSARFTLLGIHGLRQSWSPCILDADFYLCERFCYQRKEEEMTEKFKD